MQDAVTLQQPQPYPVRLWMDHPGRQSRLGTFFRIILAIPLLLFLALLSGIRRSKVVGSSTGTASHDIEQKSVRLETADEGVLRTVLLTVDGVPAPIDVPDRAQVTVHAVFEVKDEDALHELRAYPDPNSGRHVAWKFR